MNSIVDLIMPVSIGVIMFGIGLELRFGDFKRLFLEPKAAITGLMCQIFLLPAIALLLVFLWPMAPVYKIGIMLLASCPGGTASNLVTKMLNGRIPLSVTLTSFNSFIILFTIPVIIELSYSLFGKEIQQIDLGFWETMKEVLFSVVLPVLGGILMGDALSEKWRSKLHKPLNYILPALLLLAVISVIFFDESSRNIEYLEYVPLLLPLFILNLTTMIAGFLISKKLKLRHTSAYTITIEMGLQNSVLALYIGDQLLKNKEISLIAILYGSFSLISTLGIAYLLKRRFQYFSK